MQKTQQIQLQEEIYVVDTETTGLQGHPIDFLVEVSIYRINQDLSIEHIMDTLITHDEALKDVINQCYWSKELSGVKYKDTLGNPSYPETLQKMADILNGKLQLSYNIQYDYDKFILPAFQTYGIDFNYRLVQDPMIFSTDITKIPHYYGYKWPTLSEISSFLDINLDPDGYDFHRADYDTHVTALVVVELIKKYGFLKELIL